MHEAPFLLTGRAKKCIINADSTERNVRTFTDAEGLKWEVWAVKNDPIETRGNRGLLPLPEAWLCFESGAKKRRLVDFPDDWDRMSDRSLVALLERATEVKPLRLRNTTIE